MSQDFRRADQPDAPETEELVERMREHIQNGDAAGGEGVDNPEGPIRVAGERIGEQVWRARAGAARAADRANEQADQALNIAGDRLNDAARTLRRQAPRGAAGEFAERAAETLERGSTYLHDSDLSSIAGDLALAVRRNPMPWVLGALGIGYLLGRRR